MKNLHLFIFQFFGFDETLNQTRLKIKNRKVDKFECESHDKMRNKLKTKARTQDLLRRIHNFT